MKSYEFWEWEGDEAAREWLIAWLDHAGFAAIEEEGDRVRAYVDPERPVTHIALPPMLRQRLRWLGKGTIAPQNWNRLWEANFSPVSIGHELVIHAPFHTIDTSAYRHAVCIQPAMAFGTGHHPSTRLVLSRMRTLPIKDAVVIDWGCGTGILSIYAEKLGAREVWAVENYPLALDNTRHNLQLNQCRRIHPLLADDIHRLPVADGILANIERNTLMKLLPEFRRRLREGGWLLLSGIMTADADAMTHAAAEHGFRKVDAASEAGWTALTFTRRPKET